MNTPASAPRRDRKREQGREPQRESPGGPAGGLPNQPAGGPGGGLGVQATPERILLRLDWQVIRRLDGLLQGDYRSLFYGYGVDFADLREYQPGDDIRYIDWNVTARMDTPYVRQYVEDRDLTAWFLLDLSPSMDFGTVQTLKRTLLIDFVATVARLLTRHGNRVGAVLYSGSQAPNSGAGSAARGGNSNGNGSVTGSPNGSGGRNGSQDWAGHAGRVDRTIPARGGRIQVLRLVNDLLRQSQGDAGGAAGGAVAPPASGGQKPGGQASKGKDPKGPVVKGGPVRGPTDLSVLLGAGLHAARRRALVFVVSDFASVPGWERPLSLLAQRHEVLAVRIWDPREMELPDIGPIIMEDAETGEQLYVDTHDRKFRQRFQEAALAREAAIGEAFRRAGIDALSLSTEDDLVRAIVRFAALRKQRR